MRNYIDPDVGSGVREVQRVKGLQPAVRPEKRKGFNNAIYINATLDRL